MVRYDEQDATVSYLPGKATLAKILERYNDTPFTVSRAEPVVSITRAKGLTLRAWTERLKAEKAPDQAKPDAKTDAAKKSPPSIRLVVELSTEKSRRVKTPGLSLADAAAAGLALEGDFVDAASEKHAKSGTRRQVLLLRESVKRRPGETMVPVTFKSQTVDGDRKQERTVEGTFDVVLLTPDAKPARPSLATAGVALVGGTLELSLGHLCDQRGCVGHLHNALGRVPGLAGVRPHPDPKQPRATVFLRAGQPIDLWGLRSRLRDQGVEVTGILAATRRNTGTDVVTRTLMTFFQAIPSFWLGASFILVTVIFFTWRPPIQIAYPWTDPWANLQMTLGPAIAMGLGIAASIGRMSRTTLLEVIREDYVRTARAKGLAEKVVLARHMVKNAMLPVITVSGLQFATLLGGSVAVEQAFGVPGLGTALVQAINERDWMVIQNLVLLYGLTFVVINLMIDVSYAWIDPRIRYS